MNAASPSLRPALVDSSTALGLALGDAQIDALLEYLSMLARWNAVYNLTAVRDPAAMLTQHLADCLSVVGPLRRELGDAGGRMLDVGSGGGLPGVVVAITMPDVDVTSVDAVGKKAAFVRQVAGELRLDNLHSEHTRVETLKAADFDVVAARAFAALPDLVRWTSPLLKPTGRWLAMKGRRPDVEIDALPPFIEVFHVEQLLVPGLAAERCIVWMRRREESVEPRSL